MSTRASWKLSPAFDGGWCVRVHVAGRELARYFGPRGGEWELVDGSQGRQIVGTLDVNAPRAERAMRVWVRRYLRPAVDELRSEARSGG